MAADLEGALAEAAFTEAVSVVGSTAVASAEVVCAAEELAPEHSVTSPAAGDLTTEDLASEDSGAGSATASEIMDFMVVIPICMVAIPISPITTGAIIKARARQLPSAFGCAAPMSAMFGSISLHVAMLAGAALGAAAIQGLHAQAKPPVYLVTEIDVTNPEGYGKEFAPKAQATIKAAGGRLIAIGEAGGAGAKPITTLAGTPPKRLVIQQWDSLEQLKGWYNGADYQAALKIGEKYATFRRLAIEAHNNRNQDARFM